MQSSLQHQHYNRLSTFQQVPRPRRLRTTTKITTSKNTRGPRRSQKFYHRTCNQMLRLYTTSPTSRRFPLYNTTLTQTTTGCQETIRSQRLLTSQPITNTYKFRYQRFRVRIPTQTNSHVTRPRRQATNRQQSRQRTFSLQFTSQNRRRAQVKSSKN